MTLASERPAHWISDATVALFIEDEPQSSDQAAQRNLARNVRDARATIAGLREENERLKGENLSRKLQAQARWAPYTDWAIEAFLKTDDGDVRGLARELVQTREDRARAEAALARLTQPDEAMVEAACRDIVIADGRDPDALLHCDDEPDGSIYAQDCTAWLVWKPHVRIALAARPAPETSATRDNVRTAYAIATARQDEREACARVADKMPGWQQPRDVAAAIRARKEP